MQDPVADMLTRIRNAQQANHVNVTLMASVLKEDIAKVLQAEGYILGYSITLDENNKKFLTIDLKYFQNKPVIDKIKRISRPGLRVYKSAKDLVAVPGFGVSILSTSKGIMSHVEAKKINVGGEVLCEVA